MTVEVERLSKIYGGRTVVDDVSFTCPDAAITTLLGPNGAGKSTVMRMMAGLAVPSKGQTLYDGKTLKAHAHPSRAASFMLGANHLPSSCTAQGFLKMNAHAAGISQDWATAILGRTGLMAAARRKIGHLSLGMRQRLAIGAALLGSPRLLVLDEPFNGLDPDGNAWLRETILDHTRQGNAVLISTHLLREAEAYTDHVVVLEGGKIRATESVEKTPARTGCVPVDAERFRHALEAGKIEYMEKETEFLVRLEPADLLLMCNRERIDLVSLDLSAAGRLESIFRTALKAAGAGTNG